jgi:hypothetical protein
MASLCMLQGLGFPAGDSMSTVPLFDPTCPWKASCKSRRITTSAGLLRHLQRYHNLGESGRAEWVSKLRSPEEYGKLDAILRTTSTWLCTTCFKTHSLGVLSCATHPDTCQRLWNLEDGLDTLGCSIAVCSQGCCGLGIRGCVG